MILQKQLSKNRQCRELAHHIRALRKASKIHAECYHSIHPLGMGEYYLLQLTCRWLYPPSQVYRSKMRWFIFTLIHGYLTLENQGQTPFELLALLLFMLPLLLTFQKLVELVALGERNHQFVANVEYNQNISNWIFTPVNQIVSYRKTEQQTII